MNAYARWTLTLSLAALVGIGAAVLVVPMIQRARMLDAIISEDPAARDRAWVWWSEPEADGTSRASEELRSINSQLLQAPTDSLLTASIALRKLDLWSWDQQPLLVLSRELNVRADSTQDAASQQLALDLMRSLPPGKFDDAFTDACTSLIRSQDPGIARDTLELLIGRIAAHSIADADQFDIPDDPSHRSLRRTWILASSWLDVPDGKIGENIDNTDPPHIDLLEAALFAEVVRTPDDTQPIIDAAENWMGHGEPALAAILRCGTDRASWDALERLAQRGDTSATYAQHARSRDREHEQARQVLADESNDLGRRKLAAWRMRIVDPQRILELLSAAVADPDEPVYTDVLLAERHLPREAAVTLAEQWIRSFDDRRKRSGALLAALLGEHADLLADAHRVEDVPAVRTVQYLALHALQRSPEEASDEPDVDPRVVAHRALHLDSGDFNPDIALALLIRGAQEPLALLTTQPRSEDLSQSVQQRAWLIERFVPHWHETLGRPIGGSARGLRLHFDALYALRLVTSHALRFDAIARDFR